MEHIGHLLGNEVDRDDLGGGNRTSEWRRAKNSLPRPLFVSDDARPMVIFCVILLKHCFDTGDDKNITWQTTDAVFLERPITITNDDISHKHVFWKLKGAAEMRVRSALAQDGTSINDHFSLYQQCSFYLGPLPSRVCQKLVGTDFSAGFLQFAARRYSSKVMGIVPEEVDELPSCMDLEPVARTVFLGDGDSAADSAGTSGAHSSGSSSCMISDFVLENLASLSSSSSLAQRYQYRVPALLAALKLASNMRANARMDHVLSDAAVMLLGNASDRVQSEIAAGNISLPSEKTLRFARVKLDIIDIMYERRLAIQFTYWRYMCPDSSPQLGWNFLCAREERFRFPKVGKINLVQHGLDLNSQFEHRIYPLSVVGHRHAKLSKKSLNFANILLMESSDDTMFETKRREFRGGLADQGTEQGMGDDSVLIVPCFNKADYHELHDLYMFPHLLMSPGMLHILYNALREAIESLPGSKDFLDTLRVIQSFLCDKALRRSFQAMCLTSGQQEMFKSYSTVHIDWKWEFLDTSLKQLVPLISVMQKTFDPKKIQHLTRGTPKQGVVTSVSLVLQEERCLSQTAEFYRVCGAVVHKYVTILENCWCQCKTPLSLKRTRRDPAGHPAGRSKCFWKGRQGPWWIAKGRFDMIAEISECTSPLLQSMIAEMPAGPAASLIQQLQLFRARYIEIIESKLSFLNHIPWKAIGAFWGECGGCNEVSKRLLQECIEEYDAAVAAGKKIHRVSHRLFNIGDVRIDMESWLDGIEDLSAFPLAYERLLEYALCFFSERGTEGLHARIKFWGLSRPHVEPPYVCSLLRQQFHLAKLRNENDYEDFVINAWKSKGLLDDVLKLRVSSVTLGCMDQVEPRWNRIFNSTMMLSC